MGGEAGRALARFAPCYWSHWRRRWHSSCCWCCSTPTLPRCAHVGALMCCARCLVVGRGAASGGVWAWLPRMGADGGACRVHGAPSWGSPLTAPGPSPRPSRSLGPPCTVAVTPQMHVGVMSELGWARRALRTRGAAANSTEVHLTVLDVRLSGAGAAPGQQQRQTRSQSAVETGLAPPFSYHAPKPPAWTTAEQRLQQQQQQQLAARHANDSNGTARSGATMGRRAAASPAQAGHASRDAEQLQGPAPPKVRSSHAGHQLRSVCPHHGSLGGARSPRPPNPWLCPLTTALNPHPSTLGGPAVPGTACPHAHRAALARLPRSCWAAGAGCAAPSHPASQPDGCVAGAAVWQGDVGRAGA